jgi:predicted acetyltransferase
MNYRRATENDCSLLAELNHQLIRDEGHRNRMTVPELEQRMKDWLANQYTAILFEVNDSIIAYALYREQPEEIYLRQLFVIRQQRRKGIGRQAFDILRSKIWSKNKRLTVEVLIQNEAAVAFWRSVGFRDYCLALEISAVGATSL